MSDDRSYIGLHTPSFTTEDLAVQWSESIRKHCVEFGWDVRVYLTDVDALKLYHQLGKTIMARNAVRDQLVDGEAT